MEKTMCRIDAAYAHPLDEKNDPEERFLQALDENCIDGDFRELLIKHFQNDWQNSFSSPSRLEDVLNKTNQANSTSEKCLVLLLSQEIKLSFAFNSYLIGGKTHNSQFHDFLVDVKNTYFESSPLALYRAGMKRVSPNYFQFLCWLYGEDYCYSKAFFDDEALDELGGQERVRFLWGTFEFISLKFQMLDEHKKANELIRISSSTDNVGPLTRGSDSIAKGLNFIRSWVEFDSQSRRLSYRLYEIFYGYYTPWEDIKKLARDEVTGCPEVTKLLKELLQDFYRECEKLSLMNTELTDASKSDIAQWVSGLNNYLTHIYADVSYEELKSDEFNSREKNEFKNFCNLLNHVQISKWVEWSIQDDFTKIIDPKNTSYNNQLSEFHKRWITKENFEHWKKIFLEQLSVLDIEGQLAILSCSPPYNEDYYSESFQWWNELFTNLIQSDKFPNNLIPFWTYIALHSENIDKALPYIDKSIGILRGELSNTELTSDEAKEYHNYLSRLLFAIDKFSTQKGLRHRLMLQRFSVAPYSNEKLSMHSGSLYQGHFYDWYTPFNSLARGWFCNLLSHDNERKQTSDEDFEKEFYTAFACELAEFFLSRLRLRKKEKAKDGQYEAHQVTEKSSIWRQGYLKALTELGVDLGGKVHKTVNFTKKSDPEEGVRDIAEECYKAVRRHAKKNPSVQDIKRSIIAAEWWLLMCQRHELGLKVNHEEALKTRRNLMRNP